MSDRDRFLDSLADTGAVRDFRSDDVDAGVEAARTGCALGARVERGYLRFAGADRHDFLHRMLTASVRPGERGSGVHTLLLDGKGHVVADLDLLRQDDELLGATGAEVVSEVIASLSRYVLRADVRMEPRDQLLGLALVGPGIARLPIRADVPDAEDAPSFATAEIAGARVSLARTPTLPSGLEIVVSRPEARTVAGSLLEMGVTPVDVELLETLRIEAGVPAHGAEITGTEFPQEMHLDRWVDFDKGCYLGQETVARIHYRGQVNRLLCGFRCAEPVAVGDRLEQEGRECGRITSAARSDRLGPIALGYLRRELAEAESRVQTMAGVEARVVPLPMD